MPPREGIYGLLAEFNTPSELVYATKEAHRAGYRRMECYTPYPVEEAAEAKAEAARLGDEVKALQTERKQVRGRIEKLLGQIDQISAS